VSKPPSLRVNLELSGKVSKDFRLPPDWPWWLLLLIVYLLTHGQVHLPAHWAA